MNAKAYERMWCYVVLLVIFNVNIQLNHMCAIHNEMQTGIEGVREDRNALTKKCRNILLRSLQEMPSIQGHCE